MGERRRTQPGLTKIADGPGNLEITERPVAEPRPGDAVIAVEATGICGTDLHIQAGEYQTTNPLTIGHEVSGTVIELGDEVDQTWLGSRVVCETFYSTCGICESCRDGRPNLCAVRRSIGTHVDGGFAPLLVVPAKLLHRVPDWLGGKAAALYEPLACVCQCMLDPAAVGPGDEVLVTGPGAMGLLAGQLAAAAGGNVTILGLPQDEERLTVAEGLGMRVESGGELPSEVDVAIEASGAGKAMDACLRAVRKGGAFVQIGIFGRPITIDADALLIKELTFHTGFASTPRSWRRAVALVENREVLLDPLVTRVAALEEWESAFEDLRCGRGVKAVLTP